MRVRRSRKSGLEAILAKYRAVVDPLRERQAKVDPSQPSFADYQLRIVAEFIRDLERVQKLD